MSTFGRSTAAAELLGLLDGLVGVVGEPRVDLDRDPAVLAAGGLVDTGRKTSQASRTSWVVRANTASSTVFPAAASSRTCAS